MPTEQVLNKLIINKVDSSETLKSMKNAGLLNETELYLVEEDGEASGGVGEEKIVEKISEHNQDPEAHADIRDATPLIVTVTDSVPDKKMTEIWAAHEAGTPVILRHGVRHYQLVSMSAVEDMNYPSDDGFTRYGTLYTAVFSQVTATKFYASKKIEACVRAVQLRNVGASYGDFREYSDFDLLSLTGGTMTGELSLSGDPTSNLHAATKQYVDTKIAAIPTPDVSGQINTHNSSSTAHNDIRTAVANATTAASNAAAAANAAQSAANNAKTIADSKAPMYSYGTTDLTAGSSPLESGKLYFVYE